MLRFKPVSLLVIVTRAFGIAPPLSSLTCPAIALVVSPCALACIGWNRAHTDITARKHNLGNLNRNHITVHGLGSAISYQLKWQQKDHTRPTPNPLMIT